MRTAEENRAHVAAWRVGAKAKAATQGLPCRCGCGEIAGVWHVTERAKGRLRGAPKPYLKGHDRRTLYISDSEKRCGRCREVKPLESFHESKKGMLGRAATCRACKRKDAVARYEREGPAVFPTLAPAKKAALHRKRTLTRRARLCDAFVESVDPQTVFERDEGVCGICGKPADRDDFHVDHVIPLARGGKHSYANVQVAHPACNLSKGSA